MWGSTTAHHSSYSANSFYYSVWEASCRQLSPPRENPKAAGKLWTSCLNAIQAGGYPSLVGRKRNPANTAGNNSVQGTVGLNVAAFLNPARITPL